MTVMWTAEFFASSRAQVSPAKPAPTITTRCELCMDSIYSDFVNSADSGHGLGKFEPQILQRNSGGLQFEQFSIQCRN